MTNYEWIKTLSVEQLAELMYDSKDNRGCEIVNAPYDDCSGDCRQCLKAYLESEHNEEDEEETKTNFEQMMHRWIDIAQAADVAPVVHAKWIVSQYCSNCEFDNSAICCETTKYCPCCGAKMDEEVNE